MQFNILDTESTYRRLLSAAEMEREAIFRSELAEPFKELVNIFGFGDDVLAAFALWNMSLDLFSPERIDQTRATLEAMAQANAWERAARSLEKGYAAFADYMDRIPLESVTFGLMLANIDSYSGFGGIPGWIMTIYGEAKADTLQRVEACTVHELHHNLAGAAGVVFAGAGKHFNEVTVGEYIVGEGLAESFAAELYGEENTGPWVTGFDEAQLEPMRAIFGASLERAGFHVVRDYIFGGTIELEGKAVTIPPLAGYAVGYHLVQAYLKQSGKSVVEATFVPTAELIAESGFFEV